MHHDDELNIGDLVVISSGPLSMTELSKKIGVIIAINVPIMGIVYDADVKWLQPYTYGGKTADRITLWKYEFEVVIKRFNLIMGVESDHAG